MANNDAHIEYDCSDTKYIHRQITSNQNQLVAFESLIDTTNNNINNNNNNDSSNNTNSDNDGDNILPFDSLTPSNSISSSSLSPVSTSSPITIKSDFDSANVTIDSSTIEDHSLLQNNIDNNHESNEYNDLTDDIIINSSDLVKDEPMDVPEDDSELSDFRIFLAGFRSCASESLNYLIQVEGLQENDPLIIGLREHLYRMEAMYIVQCLNGEDDSDYNSGNETLESL